MTGTTKLVSTRLKSLSILLLATILLLDNTAFGDPKPLPKEDFFSRVERVKKQLEKKFLPQKPVIKSQKTPIISLVLNSFPTKQDLKKGGLTKTLRELKNSPEVRLGEVVFADFSWLSTNMPPAKGEDSRQRGAGSKSLGELANFDYIDINSLSL